MASVAVLQCLGLQGGLKEELGAVTVSTYDGKDKVPVDARILGHAKLVHAQEKVGAPQG